MSTNYSVNAATERRAGARVAAAHGRLLERSRHAVLLLAASGVVVDADNASGAVLGRVPSDLRGRRLLDLVAPDDRAAAADSLRAALARPDDAVDVRLRLQGPDGADRSLQVRITNLLDDPAVAAIAAEFREEATWRFLADVAHELRTPLNTVLGWTTLLRAKGAAADATTALAAIERCARTQAKLIDDILDFARLANGRLRLDLRPVDLRSIVRREVEAFAPAAAAAGVRLALRPGRRRVPVLGDEHRLRQVICNLLANAIKFTPWGGRVTVGLVRIDGHAEVSVADTGVGIAPDAVAHVFDEYWQADAACTRSGGLGLGLSIARQLVERHGGAIAAESAGPGQGAVFTVTLPLATPRPGPSAPGRAGAARTPPPAAR